MNIFIFFLFIVAAYLLGSVPMAYLVTKWSRGIDLRRYGSGNVGATNVLRQASKKLGILVILFDLGKGALMIWLARISGLAIHQQIIVGVATMIGHIWPVFLGFNGGRGVLTAIGVILMFAPLPAIILVTHAFLWLPFGQLALGALISFVILPIMTWFSTVPAINLIYGQVIPVDGLLSVTLGFAAILLILIIRRLSAPKTSLSQTVSTGELILNRLLFDRDIRDRKVWINRKPQETDSR